MAKACCQNGNVEQLEANVTQHVGRGGLLRWLEQRHTTADVAECRVQPWFVNKLRLAYAEGRRLTPHSLMLVRVTRDLSISPYNLQQQRHYLLLTPHTHLETVRHGGHNHRHACTNQLPQHNSVRSTPIGGGRAKHLRQQPQAKCTPRQHTQHTCGWSRRNKRYVYAAATAAATQTALFF